MWSKRKIFQTRQLPQSAHPATVFTPHFLAQQRQSETESGLTLEENDFNFTSSLGYVLIPQVALEEAQVLLPWALERWLHVDTSEEMLGSIYADEEVIASFSQIEYFLCGTDNGQLFGIPLLPPHFLRRLATNLGSRMPALVAELQSSTTVSNCGTRRLLHRHAREEPVLALDHLGTVVVSAASADTSVVVSLFHPRPRDLALLPHPGVVRSVKLWEGGVLLARTEEWTAQSTPPLTPAEAQWRESLAAEEEAAVYVFTGDEAAVVRLWRVDVLTRRFALLHVCVMCSGITGSRSSLYPFRSESSRSCQRETQLGVHTLALDGDDRLVAGTEDGLYVWALPNLSWRSNSSGGEQQQQHPLAWSEERHRPLQLPAALCSAAEAAEQSASAMQAVSLRAKRLANRHVWVRGEEEVKAVLNQHTADAADTAPGAAVPLRASKWKPKYGESVTGGRAVGVVSNEVLIATEAGGLAEVLNRSLVTVSFEEGQLRNDVHLPLSCVEPVVYPLALLRTRGSACFTAQSLQTGKRLVTSGSDGKVCVWVWQDAEETYVPMLVAGPNTHHRGLGRQVCVLRSPDIFVACGYDDGLVKEWHVYDEPEVMLRCERRFTLMPASSYEEADSRHSSGGATTNPFAEMSAAIKKAAQSERKKPEDDNDDDEDDDDEDDDEEERWKEGGEVVAGISCAVAYPPFGAIFIVGAFESAIQSFSLTEVQGCAAPPDYIYNGFKTVKLPGQIRKDAVYRNGEMVEEEEADS